MKETGLISLPFFLFLFPVRIFQSQYVACFSGVTYNQNTNQFSNIFHTLGI